MPSSIYAQVLLVVIVAVCLVALWVGDKTERRAGALVLVSNILGFGVQNLSHGSIQHLLLFGVDCALLALLGVIAWQSPRSWPIWASAFQAITVAISLARFAGLRTGSMAFAAAFNIAAYGLVAALAAGAFIAWREREALKMASGGLR